MHSPDFLGPHRSQFPHDTANSCACQNGAIEEDGLWIGSAAQMGFREERGQGKQCSVGGGAPLEGTK